MKNMVPFNCGIRLKEIMDKQNWTQEAVADLLGVTRQNISQKINKNDMKVSEVEKIMWAMSRELYEFFISVEEVAKRYNISPEWVEIFTEIDKRPKESRIKLLTLIRDAIDLERSSASAQQ
jgi:transcriptional regulator with XRE-family HTH domain